MAYSTSRLTRRPREFEDVIDLVERHGIAIHTVASGQVDLTTAAGRGQARNLANWNAMEAEETGERVQRKFLQRAQEGKPHGRPTYGWDRVAGCDVVNDDEAAVIREAARRLIGGESSRAITRDLNERGILSPRGVAWGGVILRQLMLRERNAGRERDRQRTFESGSNARTEEPAVPDKPTKAIRGEARCADSGSSLRCP